MMIKKMFSQLFNRKKRRPFSTWQIELTTCCPLQCKMCIRSENPDWQCRNMALEDFKKILPYLKDVENVVLEGWGESLLHPDLSQCIRLVKNEGARVGFVTSSMDLTQSRVAELIEAGLDFVGFSIAGTTPATHDAIRINSHLPDVINAIRMFQEEKKRRGIGRPNMHLIFLMLKDNIHEVPMVPAFAKDVGVQEVILINLCHTINVWQETQQVFTRENAGNEYEKTLQQAQINARKLKVRLNKPSLTAVDAPVCAENPFGNLYISVEGEVSPCVYLCPPLPSPFKRIFRGKEYVTEKVSFGNIFQDSFPAIWNSDNYRAFRNRFREREKAYRDMFFSLLDSRPEDAGDCALPEPPEPCKSCHKILGI